MSGWLAPELLALLVSLFAMMGWCVYRFVRRGASLVTLRDWLAYLAVALLIVVIIVVAAYKNVRPDAFMQWVTPIATAGFAFGIPAKQYWRDVRNPRFLWTLIALLVAHFAFFFFVLSPSWRRNPLLICVVGLPEMYVAYTALIFLLKRLPAVPNNIAKGGN